MLLCAREHFTFMAELAGVLSWKWHQLCPSVDIISSLSDSSPLTIPALVHGIHCLLFFLQAQILCELDSICQIKLSILFSSWAFTGETYWASVVILLYTLHSGILFQVILKHPRLLSSKSAIEKAWSGLTGLIEVFRSCESVLLCSSVKLCETNFMSIFLFCGLSQI